MRDLIQQEQFEMEVLDKLNSGRLLDRLVFGGGTMLRLCHGLQRFSVDLDFWINRKLDEKALFRKMRGYLAESYMLRDAADKFHTLRFELKSPRYPRCLKIEIRREIKHIKMEQAIAFSPHSTRQVFLTVVSLPDMMKAKIEAFRDRKEIRDVFDLEFLVKRGVRIDVSPKEAGQLISEVVALPLLDYKVKLSPLLASEERKYYLKENFKILKQTLRQAAGHEAFGILRGKSINSLAAERKLRKEWDR